MRFVNGLKKTAAFDHNNQGLEFNMADNSNLYGMGPGSMGMAGYATYEGNQILGPDGKSPSNSKKTKLKELAKRIFMGKYASTDGVPDSLPSNMGFTGSGGDSASTIATQLKYETSGDKKDGYPGSEVEPRIRRALYLRAAKRGAKK